MRETVAFAVFDFFLIAEYRIYSRILDKGDLKLIRLGERTMRLKALPPARRNEKKSERAKKRYLKYREKLDRKWYWMRGLEGALAWRGISVISRGI